MIAALQDGTLPFTFGDRTGAMAADVRERAQLAVTARTTSSGSLATGVVKYPPGSRTCSAHPKSGDRWWLLRSAG